MMMNCILLNPGSLQYADGTYGIIDITDAGISVQIIKSLKFVS